MLMLKQNPGPLSEQTVFLLTEPYPVPIETLILSRSPKILRNVCHVQSLFILLKASYK